VKPDANGCRHYDGNFAGPQSAPDAVKDLRRTLKSGGYAITDDTCPARGPIGPSCTIYAHRFRTPGSLDGVELVFSIFTSAAQGFHVTMKGDAYPS
jgi:hypothetical protein